MERKPRLYRCRNCDHEQKITTNHEQPCFDHCPSCSWKAGWGDHPGAIMFGTWHRPFDCVGEVQAECIRCDAPHDRWDSELCAGCIDATPDNGGNVERWL